MFILKSCSVDLNRFGYKVSSKLRYGRDDNRVIALIRVMFLSGFRTCVLLIINLIRTHVVGKNVVK